MLDSSSAVLLLVSPVQVIGEDELEKSGYDGQTNCGRGSLRPSGSFDCGEYNEGAKRLGKMLSQRST